MDTIGKTVIIFSLLGVCVLYGISLFVTPPFVPLDEAALHENEIIRTEGVITEFSVTEYGNVLMKLEGNQTELLLFVESMNDRRELLNLSYGDEIEVEGRVQLYRGEYELVVSGNAIRKVTPGSNISFVSQIAAHPEEYKGKKIRVAGYVEDIYTRVFYFRDETGNHRMRAKATTSSISELQEGDKIIAEGVFSYDAQNMKYELNLISFEAL
ncbi:MAG: hypothetical protein U9O85_03160 [Euryarchaeota archaeon]|nr:hypothetical protein [Euryarchaeota archaeon]